MDISWHISKERGNHRPLLVYTVALDEYERELAVPPLEMDSTIPKPPAAFETFCYPGEKERTPGWSPEQFHTLRTPSHKQAELTEELRLPWRKDNAYPEVEASFAALRHTYEQALAQAHASDPLDVQEHLGASSDAKKRLAPALAAKRLLGQ